MFIIIGGDGKEYGPATTEQVRAWIRSGRANLETRAKAAGSDEWRRLGDFVEFSPESVLPPVLEVHDGDTVVAERWQRFLGALVDGTLEALCWIPSSAVMMRTMSEMISSNQFDPQELTDAFWNSIGRSLPYLAGLVILQAVLLTVRSQSVGNILLHTRIVRVSDGAPGGFLRAFLLRGCLARTIRQIPLIGGIFWIVDTCFIFREDRRCLHDLIAGTRVIKA